MNKFIKILAIIALLVGFTSVSKAQFFSSYNTLSYPTSVSNIVTTGVTNIIGPILSHDVMLSFTEGFPLVGGTNVVLYQQSVDGVHWDTNSADLFTITLANTTNAVQTIVTNVATKGAIFIKSISMTATVTGNVTNYSAAYGIKVGAP